jgi:hypothetical protein
MPRPRENELYRKIGRLEMELDALKRKLASSSIEPHRRMTETEHPSLSVRRQCELLGLPLAKDPARRSAPTARGNARLQQRDWSSSGNSKR